MCTRGDWFYLIEVDMKFLNTVLLYSCLCGASFSQDDHAASSSNSRNHGDVEARVNFDLQEYNDLLGHLSGFNISYYETQPLNHDDLVANFHIEEVAAVYHAMQRMPLLFERAGADTIAHQNFTLFENFLRDWERNKGVKVADFIRDNG